MKTFKDNAERTWTVSINVDAIKRVRSLEKSCRSARKARARTIL